MNLDIDLILGVLFLSFFVVITVILIAESKKEVE